MVNLRNVILLWATLVLLLGVVTMARKQRYRPFERTKGINGLEKIIVRDPRGRSFEVYLYGGQVSSWKNEKGMELLFMSTKAIFEPPTPIRGGIPVLFPQYSNYGPLPGHGFVRQRFWEIETHPPPLPPACSSKVDLIVTSSEEDLKIWPHKFEYRLRVELGRRGELTLTPRVKNIDTTPFNFTCGFHPYLSVSDISEIEVQGLQNLDYRDQLKNKTIFTDHAEVITFNSQLARQYINTPDVIKTVDHKRKKTIVVYKEGLVDNVVWNPWEKNVSDLGVEDYRSFVAVEPVAVEKPIVLQPGQEWKGLVRISVVHTENHENVFV